ncbi:hypothetical protein L0657_20330 [Dyadobacter sp. CY345]|uniref:hypothetical protein n=1 Tax=Dyadobacter sp. CY345 TaxID=2909335 RepID=UPI001F30805E|nr:hypothetical protein [Dyadobacter sp. CY345]MCF2446317.1 hypothetical protein [Dyadobacter sp. CY345]
MTEQEKQLILSLLDINQPMSETPSRFSTVTLLLRSARKLFGSDLYTGEYTMNELNIENFSEMYLSFQFTALINYLILLEQLGSLIKPINKSECKKSPGIFCALKYFSSLNDDRKIQSIAALRHSLAHKFGLATQSNPKDKPCRKFILSLETNAEVIKLPIIDWDGDFSDKHEKTSTIVYIFDLVVLIEDVYRNIVNEIETNYLNMELIIEVIELNARFTVIHGD